MLKEKINKDVPILIGNLNEMYLNTEIGTKLESVKMGDMEYDLHLKNKEINVDSISKWTFSVSIYNKKKLQKYFEYDINSNVLNNEEIINDLERNGFKGVEIANEFILVYKN